MSGRRVFDEGPGDDSADDSEEKSSSESDDDGTAPGTPTSPRKTRFRFPDTHPGPSGPFVVQTASDVYFANASTSAQTSSNVFSGLVSPLTADEYAAALAASPLTNATATARLGEAHTSFFRRYLLELAQGFNLVFYGLGSKRGVLNNFASTHCAPLGAVVVANAFLPTFTLKDLIASIETVPDLTSLPLVGTGADAQTNRITRFFAHAGPAKTPLFLIVHNIDAPALRATKAKAVLAALAHTARIHMIASVDHIAAPLLWHTTDVSARKDSGSFTSTSNGRGFAWLWHDLTTLQPYDSELTHADRSTFSGAAAANTSTNASAVLGTGAAAGALVSQSAAEHVLAAVTQKAKKLFALLGRRQLDAIAFSADASAGSGAGQLHHFATSHGLLFTAARDDFIATNDTAMRALLGEFRDHGLVVSTSGGAEGGEALYIPLRKDVLELILAKLAGDLL